MVLTVRVHNERRRRRCACENAEAMANELISAKDLVGHRPVYLSKCSRRTVMFYS